MEFFGGHAGQYQRAADQFAYGGEQLHFAAGVLVGLAMLDVDDADDLIAGDDRNREERFVGVFGERAKKLEAGIAIAFPGNGEQAAFPRDPAGEALIQSQADLADFGGVRVVGGAQDELVAVEQVDQARIALHEFDDQVHDALQDVLQAEVAHHEAADLLNQAQLLLSACQPRFQIFGFLSHG